MQKIQEGVAKLEVKDEYGKVPLATKKAPGTLGTKTTVGTNIRRVSLTPNQPIYKYDFNVKVYFEKEGRKDFVDEVTKTRRNETERFQTLNSCQKLYLRVVKENPKDFKGTFFYDRQAALYSLAKLPQKELQYTFGPLAFYEDPSFYKTVVTVKEVANSFQVSTNDARSTVNPAPGLADKTLLEALNTIISGPAYADSNIVTYGSSIHYIVETGKLFDPRDFLDFPECAKYSGVGMSKSIKTLQGTAKDPSFFLTTEVKHTVFHYDATPLLEKIKNVPGFQRNLSYKTVVARSILKEVKGLQCYALSAKIQFDKHGRPIIPVDTMIVTIKAFGDSAATQTFEFEGQKISVNDYYRKHKNYRIENPDLFTVVTRGKKRDNHYPVELLCVCDSQIVKTDQLARKEQDEAIKKSAVEPKKRKEQTEIIANAVGILKDSIGGVMSVSKNSEVVPGRVLSMPTMMFNNQNKGSPRNGNTWTGGRYLESAKIENWEVLVIEMDRRFDAEMYIKRLRDQAAKSGLQLGQPKLIQGRHSTDKQFEEDFLASKKRGCKFLMVISRDQLNLHSKLKALEQKHDMLTQDIRGSVALRTLERNQSMTLDNVIHKINVKNGGINFAVVSQDGKSNYTNDPKIAFIGFETTQRATSASSDAPVMIGYASNCQNHQQKYSGGFEFVPKGSDVFGPAIKLVVEKTIRGIIQNRKVKPNRLVVFFNGVSEGQFGLINEKYVGLIKQACAAFNTDVPYRPFICVLAVTKTHQERFYKTVIPNGKPSEQNIPPGLVVDSQVVSPVYNEFYLNAHNAFQGTAKTPKYTLVFDNSETPMDVLQTVCHQLCYLHEIVYMPVALPAPLVIADRYAKRASALFSEATRNEGYKTMSGEKEVFDVEKLNRELGYTGKELDKVRYNA